MLGIAYSERQPTPASGTPATKLTQLPHEVNARISIPNAVSLSVSYPNKVARTLEKTPERQEREAETEDPASVSERGHVGFIVSLATAPSKEKRQEEYGARGVQATHGSLQATGEPRICRNRRSSAKMHEGMGRRENRRGTVELKLVKQKSLRNKSMLLSHGSA